MGFHDDLKDTEIVKCYDDVGVVVQQQRSCSANILETCTQVLNSRKHGVCLHGPPLGIRRYFRDDTNL